MQDTGSATEYLVERYPSEPVATVIGLLDEACNTVARMLGRPDFDLAFDLVQLRLDVRTRRVA